LLGAKKLMSQNLYLHNLDQFGYYRVGDLRTYSKLEAIELHQKTGHHPEWHFNEAVFRSYDWKSEPQLPLTELYRQRAQQIRDQYDYVVLFYSGGSDSTNILNTFVENNIKLDECASFWAQGADGDLTSHFSTEVASVAIPRMKTLPDITHRLLDLSEITEQVMTDPNVKFDWIYFMNNYFSPNNYVRSHLRRIIPAYRKMIDSGKSVCFVWGAEKPRVYSVDGKYCVRFQDLVDNTVSPWQQQNPQAGEFDELFYWSPKFASGIIKQAHVIMRFLKTATINPIDFRPHQNFNNSGTMYHYGSTTRNGQKYWLTADGINQLLYPTWNINTISVGKPRSPIWSNRDDWFFKTIGWSEAGRNFLNGIVKLDQVLTNNVNGYWKNKEDIVSGVKGCITKPYFLE
jgi:hypothetical protein